MDWHLSGINQNNVNVMFILSVSLPWGVLHRSPPLLLDLPSSYHLLLFDRSLLGGGFDMSNDVSPSDRFNQGELLRPTDQLLTVGEVKTSFLFPPCRFRASERDGSLSRQPVWPCTVGWSWSMLHNLIILTLFTIKYLLSTIFCHCLWKLLRVLDPRVDLKQTYFMTHRTV